ncbi:nuclear transport factor 2 family protein [Gordonia sihwensis]|uniref:nuclear transport factor 2 family protein n=1 Tax=Gordonia sihwensis TaxID=173559 RepID=UPI003D99D139
MTITTGTMTDEQRKSVALEFLKRVDTGGDVIELFADDALFCFPKYGMVRGVEKIEEFLGELGGIISSIEHHSAYFNYIVEGDRVVVEGTSHADADSARYPWLTR